MRNEASWRKSGVLICHLAGDETCMRQLLQLLLRRVDDDDDEEARASTENGNGLLNHGHITTGGTTAGFGWLEPHLTSMPLEPLVAKPMKISSIFGH